MRFFAVLSFVLALVAAALGHPRPGPGINCKGSHSCKRGCKRPDGGHRCIETLLEGILAIDDEARFLNGEHIMCQQAAGPRGRKNEVCAFFNHAEAGYTNGSVAKWAMAKLLEQGCDNCGSVPLSMNDNGDFDDRGLTGELTVNYVVKGEEEGLYAR
ncbi:Kp4-domain-containing protein [Cryomyces antarcticus]